MGKQAHSLLMCSLAGLLLVTGCSGGDKGEKQIEAKADESASVTPDKLTIYYFHTTYRCWTCNQFEKLTGEVLAENYADRLSSGVVVFKVVNVENEANRHFVNDYRLVTKSLILSLEKDGKELQWKNLDQIWILVRDPDKFKDYVRQGINDYLKKVG